jgi:hypothetical protein
MEVKMLNLLKEKRFDFVSIENKKFIVEFTKEMDSFGYDFGGEIGNGFCWGNYMVIYSQKNIKSKKIIARIYIRDEGVIIWGGKENHFNNGIVLRLFFNDIEKHREYIENTPSYIKEPFIGENGVCKHCKKDCRCRKIYSINGKQFEKCSGSVFEFLNPKQDYIKDYMNILNEFYGKKCSKEKQNKKQ